MSQRSTHQKRWIIIITCLVTISYAFIITDLFRTQLGLNNKSQKYAFEPQQFKEIHYAVRGNIFDRNLDSPTVLATSAPQWTVFIDPSMISTNETAIFHELSSWGELPEEKIKEGLKKDREKCKYFRLGKTINRDFVEHLRTNSVTRRCIGFEDSYVRQYPMGNFLNPVLGIVNSNEEALFGIEKEYNQYLVGTNGYVTGIKDGKHNELRSFRINEVPPTDGCDIYLTISTYIQLCTEEILLNSISSNHAQSGWIIVQRPYTGEILAMASYPSYTRANYGNESPELQRNYATSWNYEPGSIMKAMIFSLGLNDNLFKTNSVFDCRPRTYCGRPLSDHVKDEETFASALAKSSNRVSTQIALSTKKERIEQYLRAFGFGQKTGITKFGEENGILYPYKKWSDLTSIRIAIGQGISVTPIQMIGMYSTIANKGIRMKPYLVREIRNHNGEIILKNEPQIVGKVIEEKTARDISTLLVGVTDRSIGGTGSRAKIPGYTVAGKTGTAQKVINGQYSQTEYTASFVGFFPAENPEVTILVGLDAPNPLHQGGTVAAPLFAELGKKIADYLNIPTTDDNIHNTFKYIDSNK